MMTNDGKQQLKAYRRILALLGFGMVFCLASAVATYHGDAGMNWFARSGAILTFVSVVAGSLLTDIRKQDIETLFNSSLDVHKKFEYLKIQPPLHRVLYATSGIFGLIGTLIWGYGDLWF